MTPSRPPDGARGGRAEDQEDSNRERRSSRKRRERQEYISGSSLLPEVVAEEQRRKFRGRSRRKLSLVEEEHPRIEIVKMFVLKAFLLVGGVALAQGAMLRTGVTICKCSLHKLLVVSISFNFE